MQAIRVHGARSFSSFTNFVDLPIIIIVELLEWCIQYEQLLGSHVFIVTCVFWVSILKYKSFH